MRHLELLLLLAVPTIKPFTVAVPVLFAIASATVIGSAAFAGVAKYGSIADKASTKLNKIFMNVFLVKSSTPLKYYELRNKYTRKL